MSGTQVLLVSLLLSPYVLLTAIGRHVAIDEDAPSLIRVLRSLEDKYKDLLTRIKIEKITEGDTETNTTVIHACEGLDSELKNMKILMEEQKAKNKKLEETNFALNKKLRVEIETNRKTGYEAALHIAEMQLKLTGWIDQMGSKTVKVSKLTLKALKIYMEYKSLEMQISKSKDPDTTADLEKQLKNKKKELSLAEQELIASGGSSDLITQVVVLQEKIRKLESKEDDDILEQIAELKSQLAKKQKELESSGGTDGTSVLKIIASQDDILKLYIDIQTLTDQSKARLAELEKQLKEKNSKLKLLRASSNSSASVKVAVARLEREVAQLEGKMDAERKAKAAKIKEVEKALKEKKDLLQDKVKKLQDSHSADYDLILKVITQQLHLGEAQSAACSGQPDTDDLLAGIQGRLAAKEVEIQNLKADIKSLQKQLETKSEEFSAAQKQLGETSKLLKAAKEENTKEKQKVLDKMQENTRLKITITALERSKAEIEDSCASLKDKYTDLKTQFEKDMGQIEGVPKLVLKIKMLNSVIERLKGDIEREPEDKTELQRELAEKMKELKKAEKDLDNKSPSSKVIKELIAVIRKTSEPTEDNTTYLKRISELEKELDEKIAALGGKEAEKIKAMIKLMEQQDEITQLRSRLSKVHQESSQKIAAVETELERKKQEINKIKAEDCGSGKRTKEIAILEKEARALEAKLKQLKELSDRDIADLKKRLKDKEEDLEASTKKLKHLDTKNGELVAKIVKIENEMNTVLNGEENVKQKSAEEILDLKRKLQEKEQENAKLKDTNKELMSSAEEAKQCAALKKTNEALKTENKNLQSSLNEKENENKKLKEKVADFEKESTENTVKLVEPAIDPDTVHPKLQLSNNNKEIKLLANALDVPDLKTRYDAVLGAMAKIGFDKGRQYWEVSVAEKPCYTLGVSGETAPRKGNIRFHPKNQYWTLRLMRSGDITALDNRVAMVKKRGTGKVERIGVLIDFKKEEISFYDAGARALLYTFNKVEVKSKLFPFMSTCEDTDEGSPPLVFNKAASADWLKP